jgi:hypothetical protein
MFCWRRSILPELQCCALKSQLVFIPLFFEMSEPAKHDIHIVMVNAGMNLGCALDLNSINRQVKNTVYEPSNLRVRCTLL